MSISHFSEKKSPSIELFGGLEGLRAILTEFYGLIFADPMISYLFAGQDKELLIERELEWTARALGYPIKYRGKGIAKAHQNHAIRRGHFFRRNQLLLQTLQNQTLPSECIDWWMQHSAALEKAILGRAHGGQACEETANGEGEQQLVHSISKQASVSSSGIWVSASTRGSK